MPVLNREKDVVVTPTITAGAYSANDCIGGLMTIAVGTDAVTYGAFLQWIYVTDKANIKAAVDLYFFVTAPATIADNAAYTPAFATNGIYQFKKVSIAAAEWTSINGNTFAYVEKEGINKSLTLTDGNLYCYAVVTGTPTYTSTSDLQFRFHVWMNA